MLQSGDTLPGVMAWSEITAASKSMVPNEGYRANRTTLQTFTLPASCAVDKFLSVTGVGIGLWKIAQNAGQKIYFGTVTTETGTGGYLASTHARDCVTLQCVEADTAFQAISFVGDLSAGEGIWVTSFSQSFDTDSVSWANYSCRQVIDASILSTSGTKVRLTFRAGNSQNMKVDHVSIVEQDSGADGKAAPTEVLFSAASGFDCAAGAEIVSDELSFAIDESKSYLVIWDFSSDSSKDDMRKKTGLTGRTHYYKGSTDSYSSQTVTGFTTVSSEVRGVTKIEVK